MVTDSARAVLGLPSGVWACLFDLDGVLTRTARVHAAWKEMFDGYLRERAAALGESRPRRAAPPEAGPRPEPALRPQARSVRQPATSVRPRRRRLAPVLAGIVTLFVGRANCDRRAGVA